MMYIKLDNNKYIESICYFKPENVSEFIEVETQDVELGVTQYINGAFIVDEDKKQEIANEQVKVDLRGQRSKLLKAFDTYKTNVSYGVEVETEAQHDEILVWYQDLLDLKATAFENVPECIEYYLSH